MSLLDLLKQAQGPGGLEALASQLGMDPQTTQSLAEKLTPAISGGMQRRAQQEGGLGQILNQVQGNGAAEYSNNPARAAAPEARAQGEDFLAQIFGSQDAAPQIAAAAAAETGATAQQAQDLLPALAAMLKGAMQQQAPDTEIEAARAGLQATGDSAGSGIQDLLGALQGGGGAASGGIGGLIGGLLGGGQSQQPALAQQGGLGGLLSMLESDGQAAQQQTGNPLNDLLGQFMR